MQIKVADSRDDFMGIRKIWEERFTSCRIYLDTIFSKVFPLCRSYICIHNQKVASVISLMPMKFISPTLRSPLKGFYMFGVATTESEEGNRLAAGLIEYASGQLSMEGYDFIFERPANQSLNNYYLKLGFTKSITRLPYLFKITESNGSTENIHRINDVKTLSEEVLSKIRIEFPKRFEWETSQILEGLIALGELEENNNNFSPCLIKDETYIAIKNLTNLSCDIYNDSFFCFPME